MENYYKIASITVKIKPQPLTVWTVKVRALIGKELGPIAWDGDMWKEPIESENFDPLRFSRIYLTSRK